MVASTTERLTWHTCSPLSGSGDSWALLIAMLTPGEEVSATDTLTSAVTPAAPLLWLALAAADTGNVNSCPASSQLSKSCCARGRLLTLQEALALGDRSGSTPQAGWSMTTRLVRPTAPSFHKVSVHVTGASAGSKSAKYSANMLQSAQAWVVTMQRQRQRRHHL